MPSPRPLHLTLAAGVTMWPSALGPVIAVDASEQFAALDVEPEARPVLLGTPLPRPEEVRGRWPRLAEALEGMRESGYLTEETPARTMRCTVRGEDSAAALLRAVLGESIDVPAAAGFTGQDIVVRVCTGPGCLDQAGEQHDVPVLLEGAAIAMGPWGPDPRRHPGVADLVARRLAAHPAPELLEEFWQVAAQIPAHRAARPARATVAAAGAWLLRELSGGATVLRGHQVLVSADLSVSVHPVLRRPRPGDPHPARPEIREEAT